MTSNKISLPVIKRLPKYYRYVCNMKKNGVTTLSSSELASMMGTTASQVRQDFNCFGGFGQQGIGYSVDLLMAELEKLLLGGNDLSTILIGTGRLGQAVAHFVAHEAPGYRLTAVFDKAPSAIGTHVEGSRVLDVATLQTFCRENQPQVAVLCIPQQGAHALADVLFNLGIKGFWNFSHYDLSTAHPGVTVENVHLGDSLMSLGYRVRNQNKP